METAERKKEILNRSLDLFIEKGLLNTSTRDLSSAISLQRGGMYYYFSSKDELVIECAEEATRRIEGFLVEVAVNDINNPAGMMEHLQTKSIEMAPTMKFFASVCSDKRYEEQIKPVLTRMGERYSGYCGKFARLLGCREEEVTPYVHMCIIAICNYMIFEEKSFVMPQLKAVQLKLEKIVASNEERNNQ